MEQNEYYSKLFDEYYSYVYAIVYNRLRGCAKREDIEDCVSEVFVALFRFLDSGKKSDSMKNLIFGIAKHKSADMFNAVTGHRHRTFTLNDEHTENIPDDLNIESDSERREMQHIVFQNIKSLGEPDATIIMQSFYYNKTSGEIAEMLGMKASAVRKRQSRALKKLKDKLNMHEEDML